MRIGIDIDDTIADTYEVYFAYAQKYMIEDLKRDIQIQNMASIHHNYIKDIHGWSEEEERNFWRKYFSENLKKIRPYTLAVETINQLKKEGNEIIIITARWPEPDFDVKKATLEWLKENNINYDEIVFDASDKAKVALDKKIDLFIDDSFENCKAVANGGIKTYIMDTRTNKGLEDENITRVYSWSDFYYKIKKEENFNGTL